MLKNLKILLIISVCLIFTIIYEIHNNDNVYDTTFLTWLSKNFTTAKVIVNTLCISVLLLPTIYLTRKEEDIYTKYARKNLIAVFITILLLSTYQLYKQDMYLKNLCKTTINIHEDSPCQKWYKTGELGPKIEIKKDEK